MKTGEFQDFTERVYQVSKWARIQKDGARKNPEISAGMIFKTIAYQAVLGKRSLLELDQFHRSALAKSLLESEREMVASDSTMLRALGAWKMSGARKALYGTHLKLRQTGLSSTTLCTGKKVKLGIVDGTCLGGLWFSVLSFCGAVYHGVDAEPYAGRGHELKASRTLLLRAKEQLGKGFATHVLYDGLMADRKDFALLRQCGSHLVVKTSEESLAIIQDHKGMWSRLPKAHLKETGVEIATGLDPQRALRYEVLAQGAVRWQGCSHPLKLAWVRETHLKGKYKNQTFEFWVITTDQSCSALELRHLAHLRWQTENNGFKELNQQVGSKKAYIKNPTVKQALLLIWLFGMSLLKAFLVHLQKSPDWVQQGVKKTKTLLSHWIASTVTLSSKVLTQASSP